jgi:hypothetical protein
MGSELTKWVVKLLPCKETDLPVAPLEPSKYSSINLLRFIGMLELRHQSKPAGLRDRIGTDRAVWAGR